MDDEQERELAAAEPLLRDFYEGWQAAAAMYATYPEAATAEHDNATAAQCVRAHMFREVVRRFDERPGCVVKDIHGLKVVIYKDLQVWRFKKLHQTGRHSNYQTQQQEDFDDQWPLPGIPEQATRLTSGYMLDAGGQTMERIVVSRVLGRSVLWVAQTLFIENALTVRDITPGRIAGTGRTDFDADEARSRRKGRGR
jgi:hypothetical protein